MDVGLVSGPALPHLVTPVSPDPVEVERFDPWIRVESGEAVFAW